MKATVLVTDGEQRATLATVRALGQAGYDVRVCSARRRSLAGVSRWCRAHAQVPDALTDPASFRGAVEDLVTRWGVAVLLPVTEQALRALLPARFGDRGVRVPFPAADVFRRISDKARLLEAASALGLAVPSQRVLHRPEDTRGLSRASLRFPLVVKPARSVTEGDGGPIKLNVGYAANWPELEHHLAPLPLEAYPILLQQRVVGPGIGIFLLIWDGEILATFAHRRLREKPPSGGVSVYREATAADPGLVAQAAGLLHHFGWQGLAMVEFKVDAATRTPYLMEVNARLWGSLQLAIDAGVDFPRLLVACALGERPAPVTAYRSGVRSRWWWGDVDHLIARLSHSNADLALPPDAPSRGRAVLDFLRLWRPGDRNEILRLSDPRPFLQETVDWVRRR
jgi:predicted ATP-grasp superfamily ATP-dependent carboligase